MTITAIGYTIQEITNHKSEVSYQVCIKVGERVTPIRGALYKEKK